MDFHRELKRALDFRGPRRSGYLFSGLSLGNEENWLKPNERLKIELERAQNGQASSGFGFRGRVSQIRLQARRASVSCS